MELIFQLSVIFLVNVEIVLDPLCDTVCLGDLAGLRIFPFSCKDGISPQWMNNPYLASLYHCCFVSAITFSLFRIADFLVA
mgnify:CR=1 FL=1